jgi:hypothetical protein
VVDQRRPQLETDTSTERQAKAPWKGIRLSGSVETEFLFATLLSDNMLPFGRRRFSLLVLPLVQDKRGEVELIDADAAVRRGKIGLADWLRKAAKIWLKHRKSMLELLDRLNWQQTLTSQHPTGVVKLLYNEAGTHVCSCVVDTSGASNWQIHGLPVRGFIADYVTYRLETVDPEEAHYLCCVLNAPMVDAAIKPYQTKGAFGAQHGKGERHIHRRPFEVLPIPRYNTKDKRHRRLAKLSRDCHAKVEQFLAHADERWRTAPIGRLRTELRQEHLQGELAEIDALVADILNGPSISA